MNHCKHVAIASLHLCMLLAVAAVAAEPATTVPSDSAAHKRVVGQVLDAVAPTKHLVANFRLSHDAFPASNAEADVKPAGSFSSDTIKSVTIAADGVIDVTLTALSGVEGGVIRLTPTLAPESQQGRVQWACTSASYTDISDLTDGVCTYSKLP